MDKDNIKKEYNELVATIKHHMDLYYNRNEAEISDYEYDKLMQGSTADEFRTAFDALNMDGIVKIADLAEYLGVADKTVYARIKKMEGEFLLEKGAVRRA